MKEIAVSVLVLAGLAACGEDPALTRQASVTLTAKVADARAAAASGDYARSEELLGQIDGTVAQLHEADEISDARASEVLGAVGEVRDALEAYAATTTTTTTSTTTTTQPERDEDGNRGRDKKQDENGDD